MEKWLKDVFPVWEIEHDCILSKTGSISICFKAALREMFSLSNDDYEALHQGLVKGIKILPKYSIVHKQDWFIKEKYEPPPLDGDGFLKKSSDRYFRGRAYFKHECFIMLTRNENGKKPASSLFNSLLRPTIMPEQTIRPAILQEFESCASQFQKILSDCGIQLTRLKDDDLLSHHQRAGYVERYVFLGESEADIMLKDIQLKDRLRVGNASCQLYTLADVQDLPAYCGSRINYDKYSTDKTKFSVGFAATLGLLLPVNHIYNQYILIGDAQQTIKKLEAKKLRLQSLANYSRENAIARDAVNEFLNECIAEQRLPVKAHFNVLAWSEQPEEAKEIRNQVTSAMAQMDAVAKEETAGAAQIWWAGIPGNASELPLNDTFDTFAEQAVCFFNLETNHKSTTPDKGIRFCERLNASPVYADLYNQPMKAGITSNMGTLVCGSSGGGKSMTVNHMLHTLYQQGAHCVVVDIGGSYKGLCELLGGYYFTYEEDAPICFNPFYLPEGQHLDIEKKESLKALLVALWKQEDENFNRSEYVALSNALQGYYDLLRADSSVFPCFDSFYTYLQNDYTEVLKKHRVKDKDFDIDNFLYVLHPFYGDGEFGFLLNAKENLDLLNQRFVVFELDNIKDNTILFPVCTLVITELFISKMRKLPGIRKVLTIDEAWKAIAKAGMAEFLKYAFKTIRKFNGIPIVITQELDDLISSPIIKDAILANADIKILMDMRKFVNKFDKLQEVLGLSESGKTQALSVNKDNREIFIDIGGQIQVVYKNELCPEERYAYTTEGSERVKVMEYARKYGGYEKGIMALIAEQQQKVS